MNKTTTRVLPETTPFYFQFLTERIKSFAVFLLNIMANSAISNEFWDR